MKTVILLYEDGTPCTLLNVRNYNDGFMSAVESAERAWGESTDEYTEFVTSALKAKGYQFTTDESFETYRTVL